jgi:hypothetical protein
MLGDVATGRWLRSLSIGFPSKGPAAVQFKLSPESHVRCILREYKAS